MFFLFAPYKTLKNAKTMSEKVILSNKTYAALICYWIGKNHVLISRHKTTAGNITLIEEKENSRQDKDNENNVNAY